MDSLTLTRSFTSLLLDTAVKGTALLMLTCLAAWLCRRSSAALRHSIWCLTMGGLLLLPVASWALPTWQIPILPVAEVVRLSPSPPVAEVVRLSPIHIDSSPTLEPHLPATPVHRQPIESIASPSAPPVIEPALIAAPTLIEPAAPPLKTGEWITLLVTASWSLGVALFGVLLLLGLWRTVQLRRTSLVVSDGEWPGMLVELRQRLGLTRSVELREHASSVVPLTWGIWRPVVLLPQLARAWNEPMRRAVLIHELAHVQRGDVACQVLGRLTCVLYWFHPLAWFALRQLRQEREQACDDAVVQCGEKASDYAEQLLEVARLCCAPRGLSLGVAMAEGSSLERRVKSLFDSARSHGPVRRAVALALLIVGVLSVGSIAIVQPVSISADEPTPVPPVTSPVVPVSDKAATADQLIQGIVVDSKDQPVAGATIWCDIDYDKATHKPNTIRVESDAKGEFRIPVPKAATHSNFGFRQFYFWSWKSGHGIGVANSFVTASSPKYPIARIELTDVSMVKLRVVDENSQPIVGADVTVGYRRIPNGSESVEGVHPALGSPPQELQDIASRKSDANGQVTLDLVPRKLLDSVRVTTASHDVQSFSHYKEQLQLKAVVPVEGELSTRQAGVRLSLTTSQQPSADSGILSATVHVLTDPQGKFSIPAFPVGPYEISSEDLNGPQFIKAGSRKSELLSGKTNSLALEVVSGIPVTGRIVVRGEKIGVKNAVVLITSAADLASERTYTTQCQTNDNGEYTSFTLPGHYAYPEIMYMGPDETLIHPRLGPTPPEPKIPDRIADDAKSFVLPEIALDRGEVVTGKLLDEQDVPIVGEYLMPMFRGKSLFQPLPVAPGGVFSFVLLKGIKPDAWMVFTNGQDQDGTVPATIVSKDPLVLRTPRTAPATTNPGQPIPRRSPNRDEEPGSTFTAEEMEELRASSSELPELLKQAGLTEEELAHFNTVGPGEVSGVVLDATTRQPIVGAEVSFMCLGPKSKTVTNEKGLFRVQGLPPGMAAIGTIKKESYAPRGVFRQLGESEFLILLDNQTCFEGIITDAAGKPVADATVRAAGEFQVSAPEYGSQSFGMPIAAETKTKADGTYRLPVPSSLPNRGGGNEWDNQGYEIQVVVPGQGSARKAENYIAYRTQVPMSLQLTPSVRFEAKVVDSVTQEPVPGFVLYTSDKPYYMGRSDAAGRLVIDDLLPGKVWFNIGEGEAVASSDCEGCEESVSYKHLLYSRCWSPDVQSDKEWSGQKLHVPEGDKMQENFGSLKYDLKPDMPVHTLYVEKSATISGRVTDPDGHPVEGASVVCIRSGGTLRDHEKTDKDGRYVLYLPASKNAKYNLMVHDGELQQTRNWANGVSAVLQTTPGQKVENFDLQLSRPGSVQGRVIRKGQPVGNYTVRAVACDQLDDRYHFTPTTKTKADGTFELPLVRPGKHFLQTGFEHRSAEDDQGPVIEVVVGETLADRILEAQQQPDPDEGVVPEPTPAEEAPAVREKDPTDTTSKAEPTPAAGETPAVPPVAPAAAQPAFTEFVVNIQPFEASRNGYIEQLKFEANGKCWYKVEGREAEPNLPARTGAVFDHTLSPGQIRKLNRLLGDTKWLTEAAVAQGQAPPLHATAYRLTLKRDGQEKTIACTERGAELYKPLLHFLDGIAVQERLVYRHDYLSGQEGTEAWQEVGRELAALRGEPYGKSPFDIDYARYLPIAIRNVRDHHGEPDEELVTAIRLIGHLKVKSELEFIHRMAQDRSSHVRQEVAWTLGRLHDPKSLPVLLEMMSAAGTRWEVGFELIQWGDDAVPGIVKLVELSTKEGVAEQERVTGEDMIRSYLQHWEKVPQPIPADVVAAVKQALADKNPQNGGIRTTYHQEFLKKVAEVSETPPPAELPALPDVGWEGEEVTPEQIDTLAGKAWGTVTLSKDKYTGELIERLRHATSIRCLRLHGEDFGGQTGRLHHIAGLEELEIGTPLPSRELQAIGEMTQLTALSLPQEMTINVLGAREMARLKNLRSLRLYYVDIDDTAFAELATLTQLEELDLTHTRITDSGLSILANMPQLRTLELYRFQHTSQQLTDACLPVVCQLQKLERLSLSGEIGDEGLKQVARLPNLKSLMILGSQITGEGLAALEHSRVESLLLSPFQIGTTGLENLKKCQTLKHIQVNGQFDGLKEIEQWQTALPGVGWSFIDP